MARGIAALWFCGWTTIAPRKTSCESEPLRFMLYMNAEEKDAACLKDFTTLSFTSAMWLTSEILSLWPRVKTKEFGVGLWARSFSPSSLTAPIDVSVQMWVRTADSRE